MPKVRKSRKPPPDGWELIEPTLDELDQKMREGKCQKNAFESLALWCTCAWIPIIPSALLPARFEKPLIAEYRPTFQSS